MAAGFCASWAAGAPTNRAKLTGLGLQQAVAEVATAVSGQGAARDVALLELQWELLRWAWGGCGGGVRNLPRNGVRQRSDGVGRWRARPRNNRRRKDKGHYGGCMPGRRAAAHEHAQAGADPGEQTGGESVVQLRRWNPSSPNR